MQIFRRSDSPHMNAATLFSGLVSMGRSTAVTLRSLQQCGFVADCGECSGECSRCRESAFLVVLRIASLHATDTAYLEALQRVRLIERARSTTTAATLDDDSRAFTVEYC